MSKRWILEQRDLSTAAVMRFQWNLIAEHNVLMFPVSGSKDNGKTKDAVGVLRAGGGVIRQRGRLVQITRALHRYRSTTCCLKRAAWYRFFFLSFSAYKTRWNHIEELTIVRLSGRLEGTMDTTIATILAVIALASINVNEAAIIRGKFRNFHTIINFYLYFQTALPNIIQSKNSFDSLPEVETDIFFTYSSLETRFQNPLNE